MRNTIPVTLRVRTDVALDWTSANLILALGEIGLESDTRLVKIGDGVHTWNELPYLNKLDATFFNVNSNGEISLIIGTDPVAPTDAVNLRTLQAAIENANHLKYTVVQALPVENIDTNTIYMVLADTGDQYDEFMYVNNAWELLGHTQFQLNIATSETLGGVKASSDPDKVNVNQQGFMTLNQVSASKLYVPTGDELVIYGGNAQGGV